MSERERDRERQERVAEDRSSTDRCRRAMHQRRVGVNDRSVVVRVTTISCGDDNIDETGSDVSDRWTAAAATDTTIQ
jgi:hypothetical protein